MRDIVLASSSMRRKDILEFLGIPFRVVPSNFPEEDVHFEDFDTAADYVATIAMGKAFLVAEQFSDTVVIGADTMVFCDSKAYGKPKDLDAARETLRTLRGKTHTVITCICVIDTLTGERYLETVQTEVEFFPFGDDELDRYITTSESLGKAGSYAIQGSAKAFVRSVKGSVSNVVGLPIVQMADLLEQCGVSLEVHPRDIEEQHFQHH